MSWRVPVTTAGCGIVRSGGPRPDMPRATGPRLYKVTHWQQISHLDRCDHVRENEVRLDEIARSQSSRYVLAASGNREEQSSSGIIVGTGTGASGWLASLWRQNHPAFALPFPTSRELAYFVREPWPLGGEGAELVSGLMRDGEEIEVLSRGRLVVFGDGLESDFLHLEWGQRVLVRRSRTSLRLAAAEGDRLGA